MLLEEAYRQSASDGRRTRNLAPSHAIAPLVRRKFATVSVRDLEDVIDLLRVMHLDGLDPDGSLNRMRFYLQKELDRRRSWAEKNKGTQFKKAVPSATLQ